jgi:hypothetical protein
MDESKVIARVNSTPIEAETAQGAAYVKKVTHPPTTKPNDYMGVPDCSAPNVVCLELKAETNFVNQFTTLSTGTTPNVQTTTNASTMLFLTPSGARVGSYCFYLGGPDNNALIQALPSFASTGPPVTYAKGVIGPTAQIMGGYNFNNFNLDCAMYRTTYKSTTFYLNATGFNNQGTVTTCKFKPNIIYGNLANALDRLPAEEHPAFIKAIKQSEPQLHAKFSHGKHGFASIEDPTVQYGYQVLDFGPPLNAGQYVFPGESIATGLIGVLPTTATQVLNFSSKAATRPAKDGAFVVQQPVDSFQKWVSIVDTAAQESASIPGLVLSYIRWYSGSTAVFVPLFSTTPLSNAVSAYTTDTAWNNLDWSMTLFEGLSVPTSNSTVGAPYITVKTFTGIEIQPQLNGSLLPFQTLLPLPDPTALKLATGIFHARPDSLPASANDLGSIAATAMKYLPTAVSWLKDLFGGKNEKKGAMTKAATFLNVKKPQEKKRTVKPANARQNLARARGKKNNNMVAQVNKLTNMVSKLSANSNGTTLPTYNNGPQVTQGRRPRQRPNRPNNARRNNVPQSASAYDADWS